MFDVFGAIMALHGFDLLRFQGLGGCRWLKYDGPKKGWDFSYCCLEVRGSCPGCPGCPGWVLCGKCMNPFLRFKGVGGCRWLMHDEKLGAFMLSFGSPG